MNRFYWYNPLTGKAGASGPLSAKAEAALRAEVVTWSAAIAWLFLPADAPAPQWVASHD